MTDFVRRLVSGDKARFKDEKLDLELDLVYLTDRVIIMGYPASGVEGLYRNKREDAKRFLDTRHGKNYWVFNFCPVAENSYPSSVFEGRVSRYPFPDHHTPPLAVLPLVAREMHSYLNGSEDRVVVLHCKAGKGRSGTMACSYLMTIDDNIPAAKGKDREEWTEDQVEALISAMPTDDPSTPLTQEVYESTHPKKGSKSGKGEGRRTASEALAHVLELHTSKRMKAPSQGDKGKQGVSIPSQRRWLHYWSLLLSHRAPRDFWADNPHPKVRINSITLRMKEASAIKYQLIRATNAVLDRTSEKKYKGKGEVWVSLARYDDELVDLLESWERHTRDEDGHMELRKPGSGHMGEEALADVFMARKWDEKKMVRSFSRMGMSDAAQKEETNELGKVITYVMEPLTDEKWGEIKEVIAGEDEGLEPPEVRSETTSVNDFSTKVFSGEVGGIIADANRELRAKFYIGQIFMGWFWFIPAFHFAEGERKKWKLTKKELDFPLGVGSDIVDVEVEMERVDGTLAEPPARVNSVESRAGKGEPSPTVANVAHTLVSGDIKDAVRTHQAVESQTYAGRK